MRLCQCGNLIGLNGNSHSIRNGRFAAFAAGALVDRDHARLTQAVARNVTFREGVDENQYAPAIADRLLALAQRLDEISDADLLKAKAVA